MTFYFKLAILHIAATLAFVAQCIYGSTTDWVVSLSVYAFVAMSLTLTYHRFLAHKSFEFKCDWMRKFFITVCTVGSGFSSPIAWVAIHREHHRHSDTEKDPHRGTLRNFLKLHTTSMFIKPNIKFVVDLMRDPFCKFLHNNYFKLHVGYALVLGIINPWLILSFYLVPVFILWHLGILVNSISHLVGYRTYETKDNSKNNPILGIFFFGEWHNNHHAKPYSARHGEKWWEIDITYLIIKTIGKNIKV